MATEPFWEETIKLLSGKTYTKWVRSEDRAEMNEYIKEWRSGGFVKESGAEQRAIHKISQIIEEAHDRMATAILEAHEVGSFYSYLVRAPFAFVLVCGVPGSD